MDRIDAVLKYSVARRYDDILIRIFEARNSFRLISVGVAQSKRAAHSHRPLSCTDRYDAPGCRDRLRRMVPAAQLRSTTVGTGSRFGSKRGNGTQREEKQDNGSPAISHQSQPRLKIAVSTVQVVTIRSPAGYFFVI